MTGTPSSPGIIPLAIHECFQCLEKNREYLIRISYLEVYKEQIRDLLAEGASQIRLFDHREQGLIIKGLREEVVTCPKQIFEILAMGEKRRKTGATNMNQHSSRSHVMVRLWIESRGISSSSGGGGSSRVSSSSSVSSMASSNGKGTSPVRVSSLSLVDLAGSESVRLHGANEARRQEGHYINKSLMALGKVVYALSEQGKQKEGKSGISHQHIPYRDSKLTRLLQPSLSGNAQMVLICCISPLATHLEESHNTFKFATRAKKIPQKATIQESVDEKTLLQTYREEIEALRRQLKDAKTQQEALVTQHEQKHEPTSAEDEDMDDEVQELKLAIRNMEHLILKSKVATPSPSVATRTFSDDDFGDSMDDSDDENDEAALLALMDETQKSSVAAATKSPQTSPSKVPESDRSDDMYNELHRIQGLLGSVLKKRGTSKNPSPATALGQNGGKSTAEVTKLRAQLEQQEVASSLRKADSHFLQKQLEEKDDLLQEVSKILEQVEQRQVQLEAENAGLRKQIAEFKAANGQSAKSSSPSSSAKANGGSPIVDC
jgi:centromeric protein E